MFVYKITNIVNNKVYIGQTRCVETSHRWRSHKSRLNRKIHHNEHLTCAWNKYGADAFSYTVLEHAEDPEKLDSLERHYIALYNATDRSKGYNAEIGGTLVKVTTEETRSKISSALKGIKRSEETRKRMSEAQSSRVCVYTDEMRKENSDRGKERMENPEFKARLLSFNKGRKQSQEEIEHRAAKLRGKSRTEETRGRLSKAHTGKIMSLDARAKMSEAKKGLKHSEATKKKRSESLKGHPVSEETRRRISESNKGRVVSEETRMNIKAALFVKKQRKIVENIQGASCLA